MSKAVLRHKRIILVSGIPASGKSTYARWLASSKKYEHLDVDFVAATEQIRLDAWVDSVRQAQKNGVIDWGFPPANLDTVKWLVSQGVEHWWFDGNHKAARIKFVERNQRGEHPAGLDAFDHQMAQILAHWDEIKRVIRGRIIRSILPGPAYLSHVTILERMGL